MTPWGDAGAARMRHYVVSRRVMGRAPLLRGRGERAIITGRGGWDLRPNTGLAPDVRALGLPYKV